MYVCMYIHIDNHTKSHPKQVAPRSRISRSASHFSYRWPIV